MSFLQNIAKDYVLMIFLIGLKIQFSPNFESSNKEFFGTFLERSSVLPTTL